MHDGCHLLGLLDGDQADARRVIGTTPVGVCVYVCVCVCVCGCVCVGVGVGVRVKENTHTTR